MTSRRENWALLLLLLLQLLVSGCRAQLADDAETCEKNGASNPDLAVHGCTTLIVSGQLDVQELARVLVNRGAAYSHQGNYDRAIQDFDKAIRLNPNLAGVFNDRGLAYEQKGDYDRAIQDYDSAIRLQPADAGAFNNRALIYAERKGDHDRAIRDFDQAISLRPDYAEALSNRAHSYYSKGDYNLAIEDYDHAIKLEPDYTGNFFDRASAFCAKKEYERALEDLDHALQLNPKDPSPYWARGLAYFYLGQFAAARSDLLRSLNLRPNDPYFVIWLYLASSRNGQNARDELKKRGAALKASGWPISAIRLYLGSLPAGEFLASASDVDSAKSSNQSSQAYFYLGEDALLRGEAADAKKLFRKSIATGATGSCEHIAAVSELDRLDAPHQSGTRPGRRQHASRSGAVP